MRQLFDLGGRVAAVTGASSGIGRAIAIALAGAGASVVCVARREAALAGTVEEIESAGGRAAAVPGDLSDHRGMTSMGQLLTISIACTLVAMLVVLPALLALTARAGDGRS